MHDANEPKIYTGITLLVPEMQQTLEWNRGVLSVLKKTERFTQRGVEKFCIWLKMQTHSPGRWHVITHFGI